MGRTPHLLNAHFSSYGFLRNPLDSSVGRGSQYLKRSLISGPWGHFLPQSEGALPRVVASVLQKFCDSTPRCDFHHFASHRSARNKLSDEGARRSPLASPGEAGRSILGHRSFANARGGCATGDPPMVCWTGTLEGDSINRVRRGADARHARFSTRHHRGRDERNLRVGHRLPATWLAITSSSTVKSGANLLYSTVIGRNWETVTAEPGETITVIVIAFDASGTRRPEAVVFEPLSSASEEVLFASGDESSHRTPASTARRRTLTATACPT